MFVLSMPVSGSICKSESLHMTSHDLAFAKLHSSKTPDLRELVEGPAMFAKRGCQAQFLYIYIYMYIPGCIAKNTAFIHLTA